MGKPGKGQVRWLKPAGQRVIGSGQMRGKGHRKTFKPRLALVRADLHGLAPLEARYEARHGRKGKG